VLGLLPGGGSFCAKEIGLGIANLLLWPISMVWDPISGYEGALALNYGSSKRYVKKLEEKELLELDYKLKDREISTEEHALERRRIMAKYNFY
jgi:hypothetical protein